MRKLATSVMLLLILLNVMGYYGLLLGLQYKNTIDFVRQIDAGGYSAEDALSIKIPFKSELPQSPEFQRVNGSLEKQGEVYQFVKQRLYQDTFNIVVIKDKTGTALKNALKDYVKTFRDASSSDDSKQVSIIPLLIKDYYKPLFIIARQTNGWQHDVRKESYIPIMIDQFSTSIIHPPQSC